MRQARYVFEWSTPLEHYTAEAFVVRCFDDRFWKAYKNFLKSLGFAHIDPESVAGGAKIFPSPEKENDRDFMLRELEKSIRLHHTKKAMLFTHHDCGAYGGFGRFESDREKELEFHVTEHRKAREVIAERFPNLAMESYFIDDGGVIKIS